VERVLSRRERQIMDVLHRAGRADAAQVRAGLPDPPSYSAVRATLRILEDKGFVRHEEKAGKYVYAPAQSRDTARRSALKRMLDTFFEGSAAHAAAALLGTPHAKFSPEELDRLEALIDKARNRK
jgi:BlaI family transcriptional regulator, penicillinase repressor